MTSSIKKKQLIYICNGLIDRSNDIINPTWLLMDPFEKYFFLMNGCHAKGKKVAQDGDIVLNNSISQFFYF